MNYADHCAELNMPVPDAPVIFSKFSSAITGPTGDVCLPPETEVSLLCSAHCVDVSSELSTLCLNVAVIFIGLICSLVCGRACWLYVRKRLNLFCAIDQFQAVIWSKGLLSSAF